MIAKLYTEQEQHLLGKIAALLTQLRTQYSTEEMLERLEEQLQRDYQLAFVEDEDRILCVAGFVIGEKLAWETYMYIDDLVTSSESRGQGAGSLLMDWLKDYATSQGCSQIHLDSGVQRFAAHRFYLREGFCIASHHFSIKSI